jgi:integrase
MTIRSRKRDEPYLLRRGLGFAFQIAVPLPLRGRFHSATGKPLAKIVEGLGTDSLAEARKRRDARLAEWRLRFERAAKSVPLTLVEIEEAALEFYQTQLGQMADEAATEWPLFVIVGIDEITWTTSLLAGREKALEALDFTAVRHEIAAVERREGVEIAPGSATYATLAKALLRAHIAALQGRIRLLQGQVTEKPATFLGAEGIDPKTLQPLAASIVRAATRPIIRADGGLPFSEAVALYIAEVGGNLRRQTVEQHQAVYRLFQDFIKDASISAVTRATAADFLVSREGVSNQTRNGYCAALSAVFRWCRKRGKMDGANPFEDQSFETTTTSWSPYSIEELRKLVNPRPADPLAWAIIGSLYSGLRINEWAQLRKADIKAQDGVAFFDIREGAGQLLKTEAATRRVPIHSKLIEAGLLAYKFPPLRGAGPDKKPGRLLSQRFTRYRRERGVIRAHVSYHSLRGNFASALDEAKVSISDAAILLGHSRAISFGVYSKSGPGLQRLQEIVEQVKYEGL